MVCAPRPQRHRADRHHPAHRHREEERDHDDRLRARGPAHQGKPAREAIYQACLLRFRPIMMTTMAALLGGVPLALGHGVGLGAAPAARHRHRGRADREPAAHALHHAGDLPRLRPARARALGRRALGRRAAAPRRRGAALMNLSGPFIRRPVGTTLLTIALVARRRDRASGCCRWRRCRRSISPPSTVSAGAAGREPGDDGLGGGHAARAAVRPHRRRHRDDLDQLPRLDAAIDAAVRPRPRHQRRRPRRAGGHQRGARRAARRTCRAIPPTARSTRPTRRS